MNIITDELPSYVVIKDIKYHIRSDFKTWLKFHKVLTSDKDKLQKMASVISLIYIELPGNIKDSIEALIKFYTGESKDQTGVLENKANKRTFDFEYDAELIYSAFLQQYGIDLKTSNMHWWQFKTLFHNLTEDTQFIKIVQYRGIDTSKVKSKEQRKFYNDMKRIYKLPDNRSTEQREADFVSEFIDNFI